MPSTMTLSSVIEVARKVTQARWAEVRAGLEVVLFMAIPRGV
ncbi:hypothetical protein HUW46_05616 [Amycolatopsis sp. CA-230715]|nr:hypothetical protein HUW46_05616 [Amycolatopsis sp. CA-230715]